MPIGIAMTAGLLLSRLVKKFKLPAVTGYLIAGILVGCFCLGSIELPGGYYLGFHAKDFSDIHGFEMICDIALGFIAFSIGSEFRLEELKKTGKQAFVIGIVQAFVATLFVDAALIALHFIMPQHISLSAAITLGAIASATAPAATLMVVRQYKADGPLTKLLLPIVALDDAVGLIIFAVSFGIAKSLVSGSVDLISIIVNPLLEIIASLLLGAILGWVLTQLEKMFNSNTNRLNMTIAVVFLSASLSMMDFHVGPFHISFSSLLVCMMLGTIFCNICPLSEDIMERSDKWSSPLLALFFVISGAELQLSVFADGAIVFIGIVYIVFRCLGKYYGAELSAKATKCAPQICKYLGITLFPQAGVALGMCTTAMQLGEPGELIRNITLFAVLIYELVGPLMTRNALMKAGEISPMPEHVKNRRQHKLAAAGKKDK